MGKLNRPSKCPPDIVERAARQTCREIADELGVDTETIRSWAAKHGVKCQPARSPSPADRFHAKLPTDWDSTDVTPRSTQPVFGPAGEWHGMSRDLYTTALRALSGRTAGRQR